MSGSSLGLGAATSDASKGSASLPMLSNSTTVAVAATRAGSISKTDPTVPVDNSNQNNVNVVSDSATGSITMVSAEVQIVCTSMQNQTPDTTQEVASTIGTTGTLVQPQRTTMPIHVLQNPEDLQQNTLQQQLMVKNATMQGVSVTEPVETRSPAMDLGTVGTKRKKTDNSLRKKRTRVSWKDRYEDLKAGRSSENDIVETLSPETYLPQLIRYMLTLENPSDDKIMKRLESHAKYKHARSLINERFPECINENRVPNPWCIITALVIVAEYVTDVREIYHVLHSSVSPSTVLEVIECFYCVATFLLMFTNHQRNATWNGMHYRLYHVLYTLENERSQMPHDAFTCTDDDQQSFIRSPSGSTFPMTNEQKRICSHNVVDGEVVKVISFAGTGKTTTLVKYTEQRPHLRFLLVVFNKSVSDHAQTLFPHNVDCRTGHSLAWKYVGRRYNGARLFDAYWLKQKNVLDQIHLCKGENKFAQASFVIKTLEKYMASADLTISTAHVPVKVDSEQHKKHYVREATKVWEKMVDFHNKQVKITHDGYLKKFQLEKPTIDQYDVLLIDEAQDMTPALADVLLSQDKATILVGDPHQQIYGFRGAVNTLQMVNASHTFHLTQSFRFGSQIGFVANSCLSVLKEENKTLVGNNTTGTIRGEVHGQLAIIARSNFELLKEAVRWCATSNSSQTLAVVGGLEAFDFPRIQDISSLIRLHRSSIQDKLIKGFKSIMDLERYAERTNDVQLLWKIKAAREYSSNLPARVAEIKSRCTKMEVADVVFTTAHKSKGLEFSTVRLAEDYLNLDKGVVVEAQDITDERNLIYVAATRAVNSLILGDCLKAILKRAGETFVYPVLTTELTSAGVEMRCLINNAPFTPTALTLVKRSVFRAEHLRRKAAVYSPRAVTVELPHLSQLYGIMSTDCTYEDNDQSSDEDSLIEVEEEKLEDSDSDSESLPEFKDYVEFIQYALRHSSEESDDLSDEEESESSKYDYCEEASGTSNCDCCVEYEEGDEEEDSEQKPLNRETCGKNRDSSDEEDSSQSVIDLTIGLD